MEIIKLFDGVYELSPAIEPFKLEMTLSYFDKIEPERKRLLAWLREMKFTEIHSLSWGPHDSNHDNSGQNVYHTDGIEDYMLLCILSNEPKQGTYLKIPGQKKFLTKTWTPYLIRGDIEHRGRPIRFKIRACLRWYFNDEGKLS